MIDGATQSPVAEPVLRLIGLPANTVETILVQRGIDPNSLSEAKDAIASVGLPFSLEEVVAYSFREREGPLPYGVGRFGNGQYPVFYSSLEEETCVAELRYHNQIGFGQQRSGQVPHARYYHLIECDLIGIAMMLVGHEQKYPDLVSPTDAGYSFCQSVAQWSIGQGANALHTVTSPH